MNVTETIGFAGSGLYPDLISLLDYTREEAENYLKEYREPIKIKKLAKTVSKKNFFSKSQIKIPKIRYLKQKKRNENLNMAEFV